MITIDLSQRMALLLDAMLLGGKWQLTLLRQGFL
jgi:hypothetical protein